MNDDILTVEEVIERATAALPQMIILDARKQYAKELARHILDLYEKPEPSPSVDDLLATMEVIIIRLGPNCFSTRQEEDRAVQWADTLPPDLKIVFLMRLKPLVGTKNQIIIDKILEDFWK